MIGSWLRLIRTRRRGPRPRWMVHCSQYRAPLLTCGYAPLHRTACHKHATSRETGVCWGLVAAINDSPEPARAALAHTAGVHAGRYRGGFATRQGCPIAAHAVGARGGQDQRGNKPARSSCTTIHAACRSITDSVSLVLTLPVSPVLLATRVLVVPVRGPVVPVFPVLPLVAHLAGLPQSVKPVRPKNRSVPCGLCRNS
jgi:hypothetical protein